MESLLISEVNSLFPSNSCNRISFSTPELLELKCILSTNWDVHGVFKLTP